MLKTATVRRLNELADHINRGGKVDGWVEPTDSMTPEYRKRITELMSRQGMVEMHGAPTFFKMVKYCPTPQSAHAMGKVVWEELHHGKLNLECVEALGGDTSGMVAKVLGQEERETQLRHERPRSEVRSWIDVMAFTLLVDPAGFIVVGHFMETNYAPWARAQARILREERGHCEYWERWIGDLAEHQEGRAKLQEGVDKIMPSALGALGRPASMSKSFASDKAMGIRPVDPAVMVDELLEILEPTVQRLGLKLPKAEPNFPVGL